MSLRTSLGPSRGWVTRHRSTSRRGHPRPGTAGRFLDRSGRVRGGRVRGCRGLAVPARRPARRTGCARSTVEAIRARRDPAAVRQPVLASGYEVGVSHSAVRAALGPVGVQAAVRRRSGVQAAVRLTPVGWSAVQALVHRTGMRGVRDQARAEVRDEMTRRPHRRVPGLAAPLLVRLMGRHFAGTSQQLTVVVVSHLDRFACCCRFVILVLREGSRVAVIGRIRGIRVVGMAAPLAPGQAVCVTAEAGVATFHQIPPGP